MNILDTIVARKKLELARLPEGPVLPGELKALLQKRGARRDFAAALSAGSRMALIAEVKKASPSAGVICPNFDPVRIASQYEESGASAISVLTDEAFFQGSLDYLRQIRAAVRLPLLRKDFIIDARQIREAIEWGADAILLIAAILDDDQLERFLGLANASGLAALVEVHDEPELVRALVAGASIIGVNNRDLRTFHVDLGTTERLAAKLRQAPGGADKVLVAESGIRTAADVARLRQGGVNAILVGESIVKHADIPGKIRELLAVSP
jgi:indole-3-glycerol phosphate synthase